MQARLASSELERLLKPYRLFPPALLYAAGVSVETWRTIWLELPGDVGTTTKVSTLLPSGASNPESPVGQAGGTVKVGVGACHPKHPHGATPGCRCWAHAY